ncbi:MAG TPA: hypothetical protein VI612_02185 [Candidatus Nanoarchaeia archaeon]|nr:hypothetical protein [Candidatus Nanoarchaeia archaeon]
MANFKCHTCGKIYDKKGLCCDKALESTCPYCKFGKDFCTCETPSTKAHKPR